jgi:hypothetical protein
VAGAAAADDDNLDKKSKPDMRTIKHLLPMAVLGLAIVLMPGCQTTSKQENFATPETAAAALQQALQVDNDGGMRAIFGPEWVEAAASGDPVADQHEVLALAMKQSWRWAPQGADAKELVIGDENWPFPVPLIQTRSGWQFDSEAGKDEVVARRVGGNELGVISICRDYVRAQKEYAGQAHDGKPAGVFAQRFRSSPGLQDGLFWHLKRGEKSSPFGELVAAGILEGYDPNKADGSPFRGYRFRILTSQGPAASGGQMSYLANNWMTRGFGLLAYPAKYGSSGVMTFVVGQDGVVYEKDLGKDTDLEASRITEYNPDASWSVVRVP